MDEGHRDKNTDWPDRAAAAVMLHGVAATLAAGECCARVGFVESDKSEQGAAWRMVLRAMNAPHTPEAFKHFLDETLGYCPEAADVFSDLVQATGRLDQDKSSSTFGLTLLDALMSDVEFRAALDPMPPAARAMVIRTALGRAAGDVYRFVDVALGIAAFWRGAVELQRGTPPSNRRP
jgi:hypothetical protein